MEKISLNLLESDFSKFLVSKDVKLFFKFDSLPIKDEISNQFVQLSGDQFPFVEKSNYGNGLRLTPKSSLSFPLLLSNNKEFSLGFWLRSSWISPTISPLTNSLVYYRMSLFDKSNFSFSNSSGFVSSSDGTFVIYEESRENNKNVMKITLIAEDKKEITVETELYDSGKLQHFWMSYYGPSKRFEVYINGKLANLFSEDGTSIPESLNNNSIVFFNVNNNAIGYSSLLRNNSGMIDEVVFINKYIIDEKSISNVINLGVESLIDNSLVYQSITNNCFCFDDPTFLGITSVVSNGKNFYVGKNNGSLFKGDRALWQSRKDFANKDEIFFIKKSKLDVDSIISVENGSLKIYKSSVRI